MIMFQELYGRSMEEELKLLLDDLDVKNVIPFMGSTLRTGVVDIYEPQKVEWARSQ